MARTKTTPRMTTIHRIHPDAVAILNRQREEREREQNRAQDRQMSFDEWRDQILKVQRQMEKALKMMNKATERLKKLEAERNSDPKNNN